MPRTTAQRKPRPEPSVEEIADLVRRLERRDQVRLLRLVPELQRVERDEASTEAVGSDSEAVLDYFREKLASLTEARPMQDDDPFIGGLTVGEFFALADEEQQRLWNEAHHEAEKMIGQREYPIHPNALPAR